MVDLATIERSFGQPAFSLEGVRLYQGDCMELLRALPGSSVHLTVTSPPYNIGKEYEEPMGLNRYVTWCSEWIRHVHAATRSNGAFWLNLGYLAVTGRGRAIPIPYLLWDRVPFYLMQEIVWTYGAGVAVRKAFSPRNEKYVFNLDDVRDPDVKYPNQKRNGKLRCNPLGKNPSDVWSIPKVTSGTDRSSPERTDHPAQFPIRVIDRIIRACSMPGDIVLDPFMGSGTTAEAAVRAGRRVIGFEILPRYIDIAARRITHAASDLASSLFESNPAPGKSSQVSRPQHPAKGSLADQTEMPDHANLLYPASQT